MTAQKTYPIPPAFKKNTHLDTEQYQELYQRSLDAPEEFWAEQAQRFITWHKPWNQVFAGGFKKPQSETKCQWFLGAQLNASVNCLDRHLEKRADKIALIWQSDDPNIHQQMTYRELYEQVCRCANALKKLGIKKGDRVCIYLPMIPEAVISMLACARIGAIHSVVFAGFSVESLKNRILDADCHLVITANEGVRGNKMIPLKKNVDAALSFCPNVKTVMVVQRTHNTVAWVNERDVWYHDLVAQASADCPAEIMDANDPLFILYTSGSTGKPKGILHGTGGYLLYVALTHYYIFDYHEDDIYWCTADVGWVTGHSYIVYGPLANGATSIIFEGVPNYPTPSRYWEIIDKFKVTIFYTAPTAIRALRREGDEFVKKTSRESLRLLGSVGEPINPEAWEWYYKIVGNERCPIVDTWWQTETGGILISPLPGATPLKPGSAAWPFFGIEAAVVDEKGKAVSANTMGELVITRPWPGMMQTVYGDHQRFEDTYFKKFPGHYQTGDNASIDTEGYFWISGRNDDVIKVSGHRIGTQEVESALLENNAVSEAAVVGKPHEIKGESIFAFVTLKAGIEGTEALKKQVIQTVRDSLGAIAAPDTIQWTESLPKTRSGKIMRRILRKIANNETKDLGDLSTLADPSVVDHLIKPTP